MTHDQMCPTVNADVPFGLFHDDVPDDCLFCDLIARVRADEREGERIIYGYNNGYEQGVKDERERAAERIENAPWAEESWIAYEQRIIDLAAARGAAIRSVTP